MKHKSKKRIPPCLQYLLHLVVGGPDHGVDDALLVVEEGGWVELGGARGRLDPLHGGREGAHRRVEPTRLRVPEDGV
jgi:hypothetical protein